MTQPHPSLVERIRRFLRRGEPGTEIDRPKDLLAPEARQRITALETEIAELEAGIASAKDELYRFNLTYASRHFQLSASMNAQRIESMRRTAISADTRLLRAQCAKLEAAIASLRETIRRRLAR